MSIASQVFIYYKLRRMLIPEESEDDSKKISNHYGRLIYHNQVVKKIDIILKNKGQ